MRNPFYYILLFLAATLSLHSCKSDFEVNDDWKEINVVYGLLSQSDSIQYIKINKAFLNENRNAIEVAGVADSSLHQDSMYIALQTWGTGGMLDETILVKTVIDGKEGGIFPSPEQIVYRTPEGYRVKSAGNNTYNLIIRNTRTGVESSSSTKIVGNISLSIPTRNITFSSAENFYAPISYITGQNARFYDLKIRFRWREKNKQNDSLVGRDSLDWQIFRYKVVADPTKNQSILHQIKGTDFFEYLSSNIPVKPNIYRVLDTVQIQFSGGGEELYNYIQVNTPSLGIVQKRPEYSNISNGAGIFSSRIIENYYVGLSTASVDYLQRHPGTAKLNFRLE